MTVQTNTNVASFNGNGVTQIFPIAFKFNNDTDLVVLLVDDATGAVSQLTLNSDYTVSGDGDEEGGLINVLVAPAAGTRLKVTRVVDILQLTDLRNQGKFFAEVHEDAFDLLTMIAQQHESGINSSLRVAESDPEPARIPAVAQRANKILSFDADGNPQVVAPVSDSSTELRQELASKSGASIVFAGDGLSVEEHLTELEERIINPSSFGAVGDGVADDTAAIQAAFDSNPDGVRVLFDAGKTFMVSQLTARANSFIDLNGSTLKKLPSSIAVDYVINVLANSKGIYIRNGKLIGDALTHLNGEGEGGHNIFIHPGAEDVTFENIETTEAFGDGFYTGDWDTSAPPKNIRLINVRATKCRRQGFSITSVDGLYMVDCSADDITDADGPWALPAGPWAGLDIEPNDPLSIVDNIFIRNFKTRNCKGAGMAFYFATKFRGMNRAEPLNIIVDGHTDYGSREGFYCLSGSIGGSSGSGGGPNARLFGRVLIKDQNYSENQQCGINVAHWVVEAGANTNSAPVLELVRPSVVNYGRSGSASTTLASGIQLFNNHPSGNDYGSLSGVRLIEPSSFVQSGVTAAGGYDFNINNAVPNRAVRDVEISSVRRISGKINAFIGASNVRLSGPADSVIYTAASGETIGYGGTLATRVTAPSGASLTIGAYTAGAEIEMGGGGNVVLTAASGVSLRDSTGATLASVTLTSSGALVRLHWITSTVVLVTKVYGSITP